MKVHFTTATEKGMHRALFGDSARLRCDPDIAEDRPALSGIYIKVIKLWRGREDSNLQPMA